MGLRLFHKVNLGYLLLVIHMIIFDFFNSFGVWTVKYHKLWTHVHTEPSKIVLN